MPAGIDPLTITEDEDLSHAARLVDTFPAANQLVGIIGVQRGRAAIDLNFGFGKLEFYELGALL